MVLCCSICCTKETPSQIAEITCNNESREAAATSVQIEGRHTEVWEGEHLHPCALCCAANTRQTLVNTKAPRGHSTGSADSAAQEASLCFVESMSRGLNLAGQAVTQ